MMNRLCAVAIAAWIVVTATLPEDLRWSAHATIVLMAGMVMERKQR